MSRILRPFLLASAVALTACGKDAPTSPDTPSDLSAAEARALLLTLGGQISAMSGLTAEVSARDRAADEQVSPCPLGGTVVATERVAPPGVQLDYRNCRTKDETGRTWTLNGSPNLLITFPQPGTISDDQTRFTMVMAFNGGIRFDSNGRSGVCAMSVRLTTDVSFNSPTSATSRFQGTMCGFPVDETVTATVPAGM